MDEEMNGQGSQDSINQVVDAGKNVVNKVANMGKKSGKKTSKGAKKAVGKAAGGVAKTILANPITWKILLIFGIVLLLFLLIAGIIAAIAYAITATDYDAENGLLSSMYGISGDKFYGARFVYRDDETANAEIIDDYMKFTYNILTDTSSETGLTITLEADYINDLYIKEIATEFANDLIENTQDNLTMAQCVEKIDHFGFLDNELTIVIDSIANTLKNNSTDKEWATSSLGEIKNTLTEKAKSENYLFYNNTAPKIYVWDYILENKEDTLKQLPKKDYLGFVYMPKQNVEMTSTSFVFVVGGGYGVDVCLYQQNQQTATALGDVANANVTWFDDGHVEEMYEVELNKTFTQFTAIDTNDVTALAEPTSLFDLVEKGTYNVYFNETEDYNGFTLLQNMADSNYIFLAMDNKDEQRDPFNFAEAFVEYN